MSETACLALLLDGPLQSWGSSSRFERRTTGLHPTKSGVIGLICAAVGVAKGSHEERELLPQLAKLRMTSIAIPRRITDTWSGKAEHLPVRRLEDYHTALATRRARGSMNPDAVVTRRQYLQDARFGVIFEGPAPLLDHAAASLTDPVWGVWLGRKSCIPSQPILVDCCPSREAAWRAILRVCQLSEETDMTAFSTVQDAGAFADGTDTWTDQPLGFGTGNSSGVEGRAFAQRRIKLIPGRAADRR
jgi:CRISPR system Cascade subunit CasD